MKFTLSDQDRQKRKFPRVQIARSLAELIAVLDAQLVWPNHETSDVLDLSYRGLAARRPGIYPIAAQHQLVVVVKLGGLPPFEVEARIAWCAVDWAGLEFTRIPVEGQLSLASFLEAKLLAASMRAVDRAHFSPQQNFQMWFQGPQDTHIFVWTNHEDRIERVEVDLGGRREEFRRGRPLGSMSPSLGQALRLLSQMDKPGLPMEEFVRTIAGGV